MNINGKISSQFPAILRIKYSWKLAEALLNEFVAIQRPRYFYQNTVIPN